MKTGLIVSLFLLSGCSDVIGSGQIFTPKPDPMKNVQIYDKPTVQMLQYEPLALFSGYWKSSVKEPMTLKIETVLLDERKGYVNAIAKGLPLDDIDEIYSPDEYSDQVLITWESQIEEFDNNHNIAKGTLRRKLIGNEKTLFYIFKLFDNQLLVEFFDSEVYENPIRSEAFVRTTYEEYNELFSLQREKIVRKVFDSYNPEECEKRYVNKKQAIYLNDLFCTVRAYEKEKLGFEHLKVAALARDRGILNYLISQSVPFESSEGRSIIFHIFYDIFYNRRVNHSVNFQIRSRKKTLDLTMETYRILNDLLSAGARIPSRIKEFDVYLTFFEKAFFTGDPVLLKFLKEDVLLRLLFKVYPELNWKFFENIKDWPRSVRSSVGIQYINDQILDLNYCKKVIDNEPECTFENVVINGDPSFLKYIFEQYSPTSAQLNKTIEKVYNQRDLLAEKLKEKLLWKDRQKLQRQFLDIVEIISVLENKTFL